ncbi:hypothetical protein F5B22DRAFT_654045 [Xylaria bambusicola]|uniref:uncharacterized protein n=1 Tax=Xylaria bambusicola TaxID=326684 RepID=UPI002008A741|nr:uncharacterized protein F5B22DRAFT_654045 [Xylaria bambusicola]KAI0518582.1 hypothetical protein F5B22DRAFT_654045 [Xylaria bambusicola]
MIPTRRLLHHLQRFGNQQQPQQFQRQQQQGPFADPNPAAFSTTLDNLPTAAAAFAATQRYHDGRPATSSNQSINSMSSNSWMLPGQHTPRQSQQFGHQRDSSLSSVGSNPPTSPFNANTANPQIAVNDTIGDGLHEITGPGDNHYTFGLTKPMAIPNSFYAGPIGPFNNGHSGGGMNGHNVMGDMTTSDGLPALTGAQQQRQGGLAPGSDMPASGLLSRSRPVSVASSIGGDSPATPPIHEHEDEHRRPKNAYANGINTPKLNRTMTDVYGDELYSPNFTITSASPPPETHMVMSPPNDLFSQRIQAANNQHFLATQSPVSNDSGGQSPFTQGSPYASSANEFPKVGPNRVRLDSAQQIRERKQAEEAAKQLQRQMARHSQQGQDQQQHQGTPATISPKDAVLEFNDPGAESNFPLFPSQETSTYGMGQSVSSGDISRAPSQQQSASPFQSMSTTPVQNSFDFSMPSNIQLPHQYPFMARQQTHQVPQQQPRHQPLTPSASTYSRMSSAEASNTDGGSTSGPVQRPDRTAADGGTYTCTYHGCTLRFETPALLQKHKREGHRQANTLNHLRNPGMIGQAANSVTNSQAGPHKCERINPSTGKPCNTIFSRPYDLTRHEDTIHNAKKQKMRCDICTEEKLFSRADALTRHYRVCHPDVEAPGKHRRRQLMV